MRRILVALDDSNPVFDVVDRAVELALALGGRLRLLRVVGEADREGSDPTSVSGVESALRLLEQRVPEEKRDRVVVKVGRPWQTVCHEARAWGADLVVIGAHTPAFAERVAGSTAANVVDHLDRPVLVIHSNDSSTSPQCALAKAEPEPARRREAVEALVRREHDRLEAAYERLLAAYRDGGWSEVQKEWALLELGLRAHMATEERRVLPVLAEIDAGQSTILRAEHAVLRTLLDTLGMAFELHQVPAVDMKDLVARMRAHAEREEAVLGSTRCEDDASVR